MANEEDSKVDIYSPGVDEPAPTELSTGSVSNTSDAAEGGQNTGDGSEGRQAEAAKNTSGVPSQSAANTSDSTNTGGTKTTLAEPNAKAAAVELSDSSLKRLADAVKSGQPVKQNAELKRLSPEEIDAQLKMLRIGAEHLKKCGFDDPTPEQIAGFQSLFDSHRENVLTMASVLLEGRINETLKRYEPQFNYLEQRQIQDQRASFYERNASLKPFERFVALVAKDFSPVKPDGSQMSVAEAEQAIVAQTLDLLKGAGVNIDSNATQNAAPRTTVPKMAPVAGAGRSVGSSNQKTLSRDEAIYED